MIFSPTASSGKEAKNCCKRGAKIQSKIATKTRRATTTEKRAENLLRIILLWHL